MEWWNDIRMLCSKYLVASERVERTGPVHDAVRSVGYLSGEELELEEEQVTGDEHERRVLPSATAAHNTCGTRRRFENGALVENTHTFGQSILFFHLFQVVTNCLFVP